MPVAGLAVALAFLTGCSTWDPERLALPQPYEFRHEGIAILRAFEGYVMARPSHRAMWMRVTSRDHVLPKGAQVRTESGNAQIEVPGICTLALGPNTCIDLERRRSPNYLKNIRSRYAVFLERGEIKATLLPAARGRLCLATDCLGAELVGGSMTLSGPVPTVVSCDAGRAELHLQQGALVSLAGPATVEAQRVSEREMRVAAREGHVRLQLSKARWVTLSSDGFSGGRMCPCEINVAPN